MTFDLDQSRQVLAGTPDAFRATLGGLWTRGGAPMHDLNHQTQIVKTLAKRYREAIGPWRRFLPVVDLP